jgi:Integrase core domain
VAHRLLEGAFELPPIRRTGWLWGSCRCGGGGVGSFVVDGAEHGAVGVAPARVVPGLDPVEDRQCQLLAGVPVVLVEQLELQRSEEALDDAVVEAVPDRAHGSEQPGSAEPATERPGRVLLTASDFARACQALGVRRSVGRTGICFDNAAAESFFASLKVERVNRRCYATRAEARLDVFAWINRYNTRRLHSAIGYMPPVEWEHHQRHRDHLGSTRAA